ncbi:HTH_Tnp_Tc3_2 domain-containing protein [Trichonephila clavipes]|uniref:HTH_Tnp_Tc3_2 domain-containing protein n=1 Tax=Trichonephila clavipes TaxID=2585209 RepID=A0A8X6V8B8_TRICX|nr:HTH_Tnp_Tc3_2 domain-containing protein [Trichonephila clavipes]
MADNENLSEFERGVIFGARERGHSISEVAMKSGFSPTTISRVYREYLESDVQPIRKIAADFNAWSSTSVTVQAIQRNIIDMGFRSRRPTHVSLLTAWYKVLRLTWGRQHLHWTVIDWKHVAWPDKSLVSN